MVSSQKGTKSAMLVIGKSLLFAGIQFSLGSVEMSSKFSVKNFSKDQETLDNAIKALRDYNLVALIWMLGTCLVFYSNYQLLGLLSSLITNLVFVLWINLTYYSAFNEAAKKYGLKVHSMLAIPGPY
jgi:hypothetical protein